MSTISASTTSTTAYKVTADTTGTLVLQTGASPTTAVTIDGSQNVGIGTSSPQGKLHIETPSGTATRLRWYQTGVTNYEWQIPASIDAFALVYGGSTERMRIDSSGNVGIGTSSPASNSVTLYRASGYVEYKVSSGVNDATFSVDGSSAYIGSYDAIPLVMQTNGTERMRIDSSGNVKLSTAGTKILNSSGNPILQQTGSVLQVVSTTLTTAFSSNSVTFVDVTGLSVSITPTSSTSKILVLVDAFLGTSNSNAMLWQLVRNSTAIDVATAGTNPSTGGYYTESAANTQYTFAATGANFLDSPATTSATTYKIQIRTATNGTAYINRRSADTAFQGASTITVMEIAA